MNNEILEVKLVACIINVINSLVNSARGANIFFTQSEKFCTDHDSVSTSILCHSDGVIVELP